MTEKNTLGHIGVLMGGCSSEREISLKSGKGVFTALKDYGCQVSALDITSQEESAILSLLKSAKIDVAFIALHGQLGEDGTIQAILEKANIPYTGSGVKASRIAINKITTQNLLKANHIPVAEYYIIKKGDAAVDKICKSIKNFPVVVKPANQGSSIGITLVESAKGLSTALEDAFRYDAEVLVERYIEGKELTVGILDEKALPVVEIRPKNKFFDFTAKYQAGMTEYIVPAEIPQDVSVKVQKAALAAHKAAGCSDMSRVDVMLDSQNNPFVLEINTIPGFTATSLLPKAAKADGLEFTGLCLKLVELAYRKQRKPQASLA